MALVGCGTDAETSPGTIGFVEGLYGGVATDEPRAALVGRDVLTAGGNAADAATAMYFTLAVTLPSHASLGGGGVCAVIDPEREEVRMLDFVARAPDPSTERGDRPSAVPGAVRGMFALHGRYGRLPWGQLIVPAERLARFGIRVSRALGNELRSVEGALIADPAFRLVFGNPQTRRLVQEGDSVIQLDLAAALSRIRVEGPGSLYAGSFAASFVDAVNAAGGSLSRTDLEAYRPVWREPIEVPMGDDVAYFAPPPTLGGLVAARMWAMLVADDTFEDTPADAREHLLVEAERRARAYRAQVANQVGGNGEPATGFDADDIESTLVSYREEAVTPLGDGRADPPAAENPAAATLVAVDRRGGAVACGFTLNNLFGTGRIAPGTGIVLASTPGPGGRGATALGPMLVANPVNWTLHFAAAAAGGTPAAAALVGVAARTLIDAEDLDSAIARKRVHAAGNVTFIETGFADGRRAALRARGHDLRETSELGIVNAAACPTGFGSEDARCAVGADPRGQGLAIGFDTDPAGERQRLPGDARQR